MSRSLRSKQIAAISKVLNFNKEPDAGQEGVHNELHFPVASSDSVWKVLVFDALGQDVISSVMRVNDLRENGVTVHAPLKTERHPVPDVPAIYLVEPTQDNINRIIDDLTHSLYDSVSLNFLSSIPRSLLEDFAKGAAAKNVAESVSQVYDQYLNFIVSEPDMFSLGMPGVYSTLNSPSAGESVIESMLDRVVSGLFSVVVAAGTVPIIRCPRGNAAEMVALKLEQKLRDHILNSRENLFNDIASYNRPVLVILDRNIDLVPMLSHSWTYQALVHDVLNMKLNRITVELPEIGRKAYDLDGRDFFWAKNANFPFPQMTDEVTAEMERYKTESAEIMRKTGINDLDSISQLDPTSNAAHLKVAINALPELTARKATLDMHLNIATAVLQEIKSRKLDNWFQLDENIARQSKAQLMEAINDPESKNPEDKIRTFIIYYLTVDEVSKSDMADFEKALSGQGCDLGPLQYAKKVRELTRMTMMASTPAQVPSQGTEIFRGFSSISNRLTDRLKDHALSGSFENLISGVKNFLPSRKDITITRNLESIMDPMSTSSAKVEDYLFLDPRGPKGARPPARKPAFNEAMVFVVGGGNYYEYGLLQDWAGRQTQKRKVTYGSTDIVTAHGFLDEMALLGH